MNDWAKPLTCSLGDCCEVRTFPNGWRWLRDSKHPEQEPLRFSPTEWAAFTAAVRAGQYDDETTGSVA